MRNAELIIVKLNTIARNGNEFVGPIPAETETDFKAIIQEKFDTVLKGIAGYVLIYFNKKLYQCERDNLDTNSPYIRHSIKYHPLSGKFSI